MFKRENKLKTPEEYNFPFKPYDIQHNFMKSLYEVIENGEIGIFESPTGTGKSLSLTCGSLTWLLDHERMVQVELLNKLDLLKSQIKESESENAGSNDWISGQYQTIQQKQSLAECQTAHELILEYNKKLEKLKEKTLKEKKRKEYKIREKLEDHGLFEQPTEEVRDDDEFVVEDPEEDDEHIVEETESIKYKGVQIIYCSRTHSQLSQVVNEVKNTIFGTSIRLTSLASRQNLCINQTVRNLKSNVLINEKCLELQKNTSKATSVDCDKKTTKKMKKSEKCPYYNQVAIENMKNDSLFDILDIEELVNFAKQEKACPYYSSRLAIPDSQLVMVPYQILLHKKTREQSGIDITNSVIIIDEAHNLLDTISGIHSTEISLEQLEMAGKQLNAYKSKYFQRFSTKNLLKINQLIFITSRLVKLLLHPSEKQESRMIFTHELMTEGEFFNLNIFEIIKFCDLTRIAQKVHGFSQKYGSEIVRDKIPEKKLAKSYLQQLEEQNLTKNKKKHIKIAEEVIATPTKEYVPNVIRPLLQFLECLTENFDDGRVLISHDKATKGKSFMKYLLLNPAARFDDVLNNCRSLILAGGTMQPTSELTEQLFKSCKDRVKLFSYGHVVSKNAVLPLALAKGPSGKEFLFNFNNRSNKDTLNELASALQNICQVVPNGIVCFFCSYDYLDAFYSHLEQTNRLKLIESKKRVFKEPRLSGNVDKILIDYARAAKSKEPNSGALMLSVVGGKLSEGLNFSDELGRCVVVVGLPFPNKFSPELTEKMKYLNRSLNPAAGNEYYENLCMKAVNQCIGRAVRHINDYASVILLDVRYTTNEKIRKKLAIWIAEGMQCVTSYGRAQGALVQFFKEKRSKVIC